MLVPFKNRLFRGISSALMVMVLLALPAFALAYADLPIFASTSQGRLTDIASLLNQQAPEAEDAVVLDDWQYTARRSNNGRNQPQQHHQSWWRHRNNNHQTNHNQHNWWRHNGNHTRWHGWQDSHSHVNVHININVNIHVHVSNRGRNNNNNHNVCNHRTNNKSQHTCFCCCR